MITNLKKLSMNLIKGVYIFNIILAVPYGKVLSTSRVLKPGYTYLWGCTKEIQPKGNRRFCALCTSHVSFILFWLDVWETCASFLNTKRQFVFCIHHSLIRSLLYHEYKIGVRLVFWKGTSTQWGRTNRYPKGKMLGSITE